MSLQILADFAQYRATSL